MRKHERIQHVVLLSFFQLSFQRYLCLYSFIKVLLGTKKYVVPRSLDPRRDPQRVDHTELQKRGLFGSTSHDRDPIQPAGTSEEGVRSRSLFGRVFKGKNSYISRKKSYIQHGSFGYRELQRGLIARKLWAQGVTLFSNLYCAVLGLPS